MQGDKIIQSSCRIQLRLGFLTGLPRFLPLTWRQQVHTARMCGLRHWLDREPQASLGLPEPRLQFWLPGGSRQLKSSILWNTQIKRKVETVTSLILMSSSELYNLPAVACGGVNKVKGGETKWKTALSSAIWPVRPAPSWTAEISIQLLSYLIGHLSFYNYLSKLCNLTLDATTP